MGHEAPTLLAGAAFGGPGAPRTDVPAPTRSGPVGLPGDFHPRCRR